MHEPPLPKVVVIGGSIAGLSTGIALRCLGCDVQIYEQSPTSLRGRGGGLVVQYEMLDWMASHGIATRWLHSASPELSASFSIATAK
jgi:2-polyprenyl-6-methoxyphenol hydroxylase-like FAD-dependent oxidoreductase